MRYFVGNWKMFGVPNSIGILNKINRFVSKDKNNKKYRVLVTPPFTLLESFSKIFKKKAIRIGSQNCFHKDYFSSNTGAISPYMVRKVGAEFIIIGHSDNRAEGDSNKLLQKKVLFSIKNNLKVIFCIGENKTEKRKKITGKVLKSQITKVLIKKFNGKNIILAYEPIWSIGSGKIPSEKDLIGTIRLIKKTLKKIFGAKSVPKVLYGGSVDSKNIKNFKKIIELDGFLIGGASKSSKNFIDIIKNYYR